jgi:hypothetical protein
MFKNVLVVDIVQLIILFDKHTKIHLNDRKYQMCQKILETHIVQLIHILLHENVLGVYVIFFYKLLHKSTFTSSKFKKF